MLQLIWGHSESIILVNTSNLHPIAKGNRANFTPDHSARLANRVTAAYRRNLISQKSEKIFSLQQSSIATFHCDLDSFPKHNHTLPFLIAV